MQLPIPQDACAFAREMISHGLFDPDTVLEFMRGDVVCLRGKARVFADRMVIERANGPRHVRYQPFDAKAKARLSRTVDPPMRQNGPPLP